MTDIELLAWRVNHVIVKILGVLGYDGLRQRKDVLSDEADQLCLCQFCERRGLYPLDK